MPVPMKIDPENVVEMCLEELVTRNMVDVVRWGADGVPKTCCMSNVIYDFFSSKAANYVGFQRLAANVETDYLPSSLGCIQNTLSYVAFDTRVCQSHLFRNLAEHHRLQELYLLAELPESVINVGFLPPNIKKLTLSLSKLATDPMPELEKISVWSADTAAYSVAIFVLGIISNNLSDKLEDLGGFINYGERTWVLGAASYQIHRKSVQLERLDHHHFNEASYRWDRNAAIKMMKPEYDIKSKEGYIVRIDKCPCDHDVPVSIDFSGFNNDSISDEKIFLDHKAKNYSKIDISITVLLLAVAVVLEMYAAIVLIFSDRFSLWLINHNKTSTFQILNGFQLFKSPRLLGGQIACHSKL
ncbi:hypothetical protein Dsin_032665 [Dipteronia sinensis]|uniref:DUF4220 domain-containing protein n=1 Tax=Dipteronia sinensis TaxID=43782 RepID=A0AAD9Z9C7_9ROSI|nr:hypothetical protein Dsin_032665 [Dipteronia sinensis]